MAWRDSRRSRSKLFLFTTSIAIGIAALVGINSFKLNLDDEIAIQAKELLGADLEIISYQRFTTEQYQLIDSLGTDYSYQTKFSSMVQFTRTKDTRLVQVRAIRGGYPYYGQIETEPDWAAGDVSNGQFALVDEKLMLQYNAEIGDEIAVGNLKFIIRGKLKSVPGQGGMATAIAPVIYIDHLFVGETGLIKKGSRVTFSRFYKYDSDEKLEEILAENEERISALNLNYDTVEKRKKETTTSFENLSIYLNLAAFIALLLGSVGVAGAVHIYLKEKNQHVAVLRCLGLGAKHAFFIYLVQVIAIGIIGSLIGITIGMSLQYVLPQVLGDLLPISITPHVYWSAGIQGLVIGLLITILFSMVPLYHLGNVSPLLSIRAPFEEGHQTKSNPWFIYLIIAAFLYAFTYFQIGNWMQALYFIGGLGLTVGLLLLLSKGLLIAAKRSGIKKISFAFKQGISNLHRPNNQSTELLLTIGMCTVLVATLLFARFILVEQITMVDADDRPNMVLFDIQSSQKEELKTLTTEYDLEVKQEVPVVTMRLKEINGITKKQADEDSTLEIPKWVFNREYRVTFRDELIESETLSEGRFQKKVAHPNDSIFITVSEGFAENLEWEIGDEVLFNVQGTLIKTYIGGFRKIDWRRVQTNFIILFPKGVLEEAPQFHVMVTKVDQSDVSVRYQQAVVTLFPNVSIIDLALILKTLEEVLNKISFAINFMASFSLVTGLIVLAGAVVLSQSQRIKESVLLRTLGASTRQIFRIIALEYFILGFIGALAGLLLSNGFSWALAVFVFENDFLFSGYYNFMILFSITFGTVLIGVSNIRPVLKKSPLEILRKEI